ncbi:MAG: cell wall-binding repeat-containing protein [Microcella sp.]|uniref:cell wall-binding repeat-containing protein n=1 Tax=Microcella sp. TaxID=1913979 RepID=UPI003315B849
MGSLLVAPTAASAAGTASISGTVIDQGSTLPIQGITVTLWNSDLPLTDVANASTDENGEYSLEGLDAGTYKLSFTGVGPTANYRPAWYPSGTFFPNATPFTLADAETLVADAELVTEATIQGTVVGADGPTGDELFVQAWEEDGGEYTSVGGDLVEWDTNPVSWEIDLLPGTYVLNFSDQRPDGPGTYRTEVYDNVFAFEDGVEITVVSSQVFDVPQVTMTTLGPVANERLSGANRYETAVAVSQQFDSFAGAEGSYVYIASGANYPDALSAGPAAAFRDAPLLLTEGTSLPTAVRNELIRLQPETVIIAGGSAVVSNSVRSAIDAVVDTVVRIGGANRYETSRLLVDDAFPSASDAFIATGANFPDALAATAAAAKKSAPVILVDGTASSVPSATRSLIGSGGLGVTDVYIAGGTAVVSNGVSSSLAGIDSVSSVTRLGGADRYATSVLINSELFVTQDVGDDPNAFFAVGTGFADALAGAALAGAQDPSAPLFTVPRTCVPSDVLDLFETMKVEKIWLLGGTAVLTNGVRDLTAC